MRLITIIFSVLTLTSAYFAHAGVADDAKSENDAIEASNNISSGGAGVAAVGFDCKECIARLKHGRRGDATAAQPRSDSNSTTPASGAAGATE